MARTAKVVIIISILLFASVAGGGRIITWLCNQNYTRTQLENVTWSQMKTMAENRGIDPETIKPYRRTIMNAVWSDWRQKRIEIARLILETKVQEYDATGIVRYVGQDRSSVDPNKMVSMFTVEVDLNLERK
jgi:hypothetical protein